MRCFLFHGGGASRSLRRPLASEEMMEELEKVVEALLKRRRCIATWKGTFRLEIEMVKAAKLEQDVKTEQIRQDHIKKSKHDTDEGGTITGIKGYANAPKPEQ